MLWKAIQSRWNCFSVERVQCKFVRNNWHPSGLGYSFFLPKGSNCQKVRHLAMGTSILECESECFSRNMPPHELCRERTVACCWLTFLLNPPPWPPLADETLPYGLLEYSLPTGGSMECDCQFCRRDCGAFKEARRWLADTSPT